MELFFNIGGLILQLATIAVVVRLGFIVLRNSRENKLLRHQVRLLRRAVAQGEPVGPEEYHRRMTAGRPDSLVDR